MYCIGMRIFVGGMQGEPDGLPDSGSAKFARDAFHVAKVPIFSRWLSESSAFSSGFTSIVKIFLERKAY